MKSNAKTEATFQADFLLDGKAVLDEQEDGIMIEGYASDFGLDRQDEAFEPGAFEKGMREFMKNPVLLYHHKFDLPMGQIKGFEHRPDGLFVKAWVDKPAPAHPVLADVYQKVKSRTIRGFSVGGKFHRAVKGKIHTADLIEVSITPTPVNPRARFDLASVAGKAFGDTTDLDAALAAIEATRTAFAELDSAL